MASTAPVKKPPAGEEQLGADRVLLAEQQERLVLGGTMAKLLGLREDSGAVRG